MIHYIAISADGRIVGHTALSDGSSNPFTPEALTSMTPHGVRTMQINTAARVREQKMDVQDNLVDDLETPEIDRAGLEDADFDKIKDGLRSVVMAMNTRLTTAGLLKITAAEVKANYKQLRNHP